MSNKTLQRSVLLATLALWLAASAYASPIFELGNHPQSDEENILLKPDNQMGSLIFGITNHSGVTVNFSSTTDVLENPAQGQAKIVAQDGAINDITISVPGHTFTDLIFNLEIGKLGSSTADVQVNASDGIFNFQYTLANGENYLTIIASQGETFNSVTIDDSTGFFDLKQPRISGISGVPPVPEPATIALLGAGLLVAGKKLRQWL